jgi:lytic murein transglycosylase
MTRTATALGLAAVLAASPAFADFQGCLAQLEAASKAQGVDSATFASATRGLTPNPDVLGFASAQPEFTTPIWDYMAGLVDAERVEEGRAMLQRWHRAFATAQSRFGVDAAVVAAVWGVESDYGKGFGFRPIVQSLATLTCAGGRRQAYFRDEFIAALKIIQAGDVDPRQFNGSWAGAFGHTQFMPTTFLRMAVDLDGDGHRDIINSVPDALGSTANYLSKHGWVEGAPWGFEVRLPDHYSGPSGRSHKEAMAAWAARGITRIDGSPLGQGSAALIMPAGPQGPAFLVTHNFDAIFSYNAAESYALAIAVLSDLLRGRSGILTPWPTKDPGLSRAERREVQGLLIRRGYDLDGKTDGVMGTKTRAAISDFQARHGLQQDGRAGEALLDTLRHSQ